MKKKLMKYAFCVLGIVGVCFAGYHLWIEHFKFCQSENVSDPFVTLTGTLHSKVFPGPPEYSSIEDGDRADSCWVLNLDKASFILALNAPVQELSLDFEDIMKWPKANEMILVTEENMEEWLRSQQGKYISISGYLFHAHTAHHYSPMLLIVRNR